MLISEKLGVMKIGVWAKNEVLALGFEFQKGFLIFSFRGKNIGMIIGDKSDKRKPRMKGEEVTVIFISFIK